jgi:hypothetical protein
MDPDEFLDERVAALDDKLSSLLAEMEATVIEWATDIAGTTAPPKSEEA